MIRLCMSLCAWTLLVLFAIGCQKEASSEREEAPKETSKKTPSPNHSEGPLAGDAETSFPSSEEKNVSSNSDPEFTSNEGTSGGSSTEDLHNPGSVRVIVKAPNTQSAPSSSTSTMPLGSLKSELVDLNPTQLFERIEIVEDQLKTVYRCIFRRPGWFSRTYQLSCDIAQEVKGLILPNTIESIRQQSRFIELLNLYSETFEVLSNRHRDKVEKSDFFDEFGYDYDKLLQKTVSANAVAKEKIIVFQSNLNEFLQEKITALEELGCNAIQDISCSLQGNENINSIATLFDQLQQFFTAALFVKTDAMTIYSQFFQSPYKRYLEEWAELFDDHFKRLNLYLKSVEREALSELPLKLSQLTSKTIVITESAQLADPFLTSVRSLLLELIRLAKESPYDLFKNKAFRSIHIFSTKPLTPTVSNLGSLSRPIGEPANTQSRIAHDPAKISMSIKLAIGIEGSSIKDFIRIQPNSGDPATIKQINALEEIHRIEQDIISRASLYRESKSNLAIRPSSNELTLNQYAQGLKTIAKYIHENPSGLSLIDIVEIHGNSFDLPKIDQNADNITFRVSFDIKPLSLEKFFRRNYDKF